MKHKYRFIEHYSNMLLLSTDYDCILSSIRHARMALKIVANRFEKSC
jgi:hypothetical protein